VRSRVWILTGGFELRHVLSSGRLLDGVPLRAYEVKQLGSAKQQTGTGESGDE
jgi:hypothetical protein